MTPQVFFESSLTQTDPMVLDAIKNEYHRQNDQIELIASENIVSKAVLEAQGTILTNKYAEGYSGKRYYGGCEHVDVVEDICIDRIKKLFNADFANVQVHSGSQANQAVFLALLKPGDTIMGMSLAAGGHLTHGAPPNESGKWFNAVQYGVNKDTTLIDFEEVEGLALEHKPKLIIAGGSAYPRIIDFKKFKEIADKVGAYFLVDMAHFAGLVATGVYPNPLDFADVVTSTTHKTLRGPRGGIVLTNNPDHAKKINSAVFPGLQGGPHNHTTAGLAVALKEAQTEEFKKYARQIVTNADVLAKSLINRGFSLSSGGTDNHLILIDLTNKGVTGRQMAKALDASGIVCNFNRIPFDKRPAMNPSGIRIGTPAITSRGFGINEMERLANWMETVAQLRSDESLNLSDRKMAYKNVAKEVKDLCDQFPAPGLCYDSDC